MKKILFIAVAFMAWLTVAAQPSKGYLRYDSVIIQKIGGNAELIVLNGTRDSTGGLLINIGGGRTKFVKPKQINDSTLIIGLDTFRIKGGGGGAAFSKFDEAIDIFTGKATTKELLFNTLPSFRSISTQLMNVGYVYRTIENNKVSEWVYTGVDGAAVDDSAMTIKAPGNNTFKRIVRDGVLWPWMFRAVGDGSTDDWYPLQKMINYAIANNTIYNTIQFENKTYRCNKELILYKWNGTDYAFFTLRLIGQSTFWPTSGAGSRILFFNKNTFGVGIQDGKGCEIKSLIIQGQYQPPTGTDFALYNSTFEQFRDPTMRDSTLSAWGNVVIDPFTRQPVDTTTGQYYPTLGSWYRGTGASSAVSRVTGSTGIMLQDLQLNNGVVGVLFSPNGLTRNAENIRGDNIQFNSMKLCISNGQDQEKNNRFTHINSWGVCHTIFASGLYGAQIPGDWYIDGANLAGINVRFISYAGSGYFASYLNRIYAEALGQFGTISTSTIFNVENSDFNFITPGVTGKALPDAHVDATQGVNFQSCRFRLYGTFEPVILTGGATYRDCYFERVPFYGYKNDLSLYHSKFFNCRIGVNGQVLGIDRDVVKGFSNSFRYTPMYGKFNFHENTLLNVGINANLRARYEVESVYPFWITRTEAQKAVTLNTTTRKITFTVPVADIVLWKPGNICFYQKTINNYEIAGVVDSVAGDGTILVRFVPASFVNGTYYFFCTWDKNVGEDFIGDISVGSSSITNVRYGQFFAIGVQVGDIITHGKYFGAEAVIVTGVSGSTVTVNKQALITATGVYLGNGTPHYEDVSGVDTLQKMRTDFDRQPTLAERSTITYAKSGSKTVLEVQTPGLLCASCVSETRQAGWKQIFPVPTSSFTTGFLMTKAVPDTINFATQISWIDAQGHVNQFDQYVDSTKSDANDGRTEATARKTIGAAMSYANLLAPTTQGQATVGLRANHQFREQVNPVSGIRILSYGINAWDFKMPAIITGAEIHNSGWTDSLAGAIQFKTITMGAGVSGANPAYDYAGFVIIDTIQEKLFPFSSRIYFRAATSLANCVATAGSFWHGTLGSTVKLYINTTGYAAPGAGIYRSEVFTRLSAITGTGSQSDVQMRNIIFRDVVGGYGPIGGNSGGIRNFNINGCFVQGGMTHGIVGTGILQNSIVAPGGQDAAQGDIGVAFYFGNATGLSSLARNNVLFDWKSFFLQHNSSSGTNDHEYGGYFGNYMFGNASYSAGGIGLVGVKYADIKYNYLENCGSFFTGIPNVVNIESNIFRNISNKSNIEAPSATPVQFNFFNNLLVFNAPNSGTTRSIILANQATHVLNIQQNIIEAKSALVSSEGSLVVSRVTAFAAPTPLTFKYNIVICESATGATTKIYSFDQNGTSGLAAGVNSDYNVYIIISGDGPHWSRSNAFGGGAPNLIGLPAMQAATNQEQNSIQIDLRSNTALLKQIFTDPDNGNWTFVNTAEANSIKAIASGMRTPPTYYPSRPTMEQAYATLLNGQGSAAPRDGWQYGAGSGGGSGGGTSSIAWLLDGTNTATNNSRKIGLSTLHSWGAVNGGQQTMLFRYDNSVIISRDSTGVNIGDGLLTLKPNVPTQNILLLTGTINGDKHAITSNITINQTANSQAMAGEDILITFVPGAFTGGAAYGGRRKYNWAGNAQFVLENTNAGGRMVLQLIGFNNSEAFLFYSDGRMFSSTGDVTATPAGTSNKFIVDKSFNNPGANFINGRLRVGDGTSPAVGFEVIATDAIRAALGTTAQRPTGAAGYIRANSDSANNFEFFDGTFWRQFASRNWTLLNFVDMANDQSNINGVKIFNSLVKYTFDLSALFDARSHIDKGYLEQRLAELSEVFIYEVTTSDATPVTVATFTTLQNEVISIEVTADGPAHSAGGGYTAKKSRSYYKNTGGTLSVGDLYTDRSDQRLGTGLTTCTFTLTSASDEPILQWTGQPSTPMTVQFTVIITRKFVAL